MRRDQHSDIKAVQLLSAALKTATFSSTGVDLTGFNAVDFLIDCGTITNVANSPQPSWTFKLQESDDDSTYTDVTDSNDVLVGSAASPVAAPNASTGVFLTIDSAAEDAALYRIGYIGDKRYARVVATAANTPGNTPMSICAVLGYPNLRPTAD